MLPRLALLAICVLMQSTALADAKLPQFSWDRVPLYAHFGIGEGLEPQQYDFLAEHFSLIGLTAGRVRNGSAELHTAAAARELKHRNPAMKVLFYWASDKPKHQSKIANAAYPGEYLIHTRSRKGQKDEVTSYFDVERPEVQNWWSDAASDAVHKYSCDGIFVDGAVAGHPQGPYARSFGKEKAAAMNEAVFAMLRDARRKMGPDTLIVFNPLHGTDGKKDPLGQEQLQVTDGAMIDDFDRGGKARQQSMEYMVNTLGTMRHAARAGKIVLFKGWPDFTMAWRKSAEVKKSMSLEDLRREARKDILFPLACFLLAAEKQCYFCYTWGWEPDQGSLGWYPEFDQPLGPPKGDAVRDGWTFRREFEHASVLVDVEKQIAKINWK
jgi:hypothetical protein